MRIIFRVDASDRMGGGHVMRCLTLANAVALRGGRATFVCAQAPPAIAGRVRECGHQLISIDPIQEASGPPAEWDLAVHDPADQKADAERTMTAAGADDADWIVLDHYRLAEAWESAARQGGAAVLVIDDLANRRHDCDVLVDQTYGRRAGDYETLVPSRCVFLIGAEYAPLRPEFAAARPRALSRRATARDVQRLLITLGSTDVGGVTGRVLSAVIPVIGGCQVDVVLSTGAPSMAAVEALAREHPNVVLHVDCREMASLMTDADLAIGAAGTTSWERCCLGLPALTLVLAANQRFIAEQLGRAGVHRIAPSGRGPALRAALGDIMQDSAARLQMAERAATVTDGRGTDRICDAMLGRT